VLTCSLTSPRHSWSILSALVRWNHRASSLASLSLFKFLDLFHRFSTAIHASRQPAWSKQPWSKNGDKDAILEQLRRLTEESIDSIDPTRSHTATPDSKVRSANSTFDSRSTRVARKTRKRERKWNKPHFAELGTPETYCWRDTRVTKRNRDWSRLIGRRPFPRVSRMRVADPNAIREAGYRGSERLETRTSSAVPHGTLDARECVVKRTHSTRPRKDASGYFTRYMCRHTSRSHPGWLFLRTPGQSRLAKIIVGPAVAPPSGCHRRRSLAANHHGVWSDH